MGRIDEVLREMADPGYRAFQMRLIPTVDPARVIGVRVPDLRRYARTIAGGAEAAAFLAELPHASYDADNLHAILLAMKTDRDALMAGLDAFLPHIDNWATCDMLRPRLLGRDIPALRREIGGWMDDPRPFICRFGIEMLMVHCLGDAFSAADLDAVAAVADARADEYYVAMMCAWYFATALAMREETVLPCFLERRLSPRVHGYAVRKACESYRVRAEVKAMLRGDAKFC